MKERITYCLLSPFLNQIWFFLDIWLLTSAADCWFLSIHGDPVFGCYMTCHGFVLTYAIVFICQFIKGFAGKVLKGILVFLGILNLITDTLVHNIMHFGFTQDMVAIILGSNTSEASEFLAMYFTPYAVCFICTVLAITFCIWYFRDYYRKYIKTWMAIIALAACILSASAIIIRKSNNWEGLFLCKIKTFLSYEKPIDLRLFRTFPEVTPSDNQPDNIVLIIGESLSRNHCSLYGYEKQTQPCLEKMLKDSLIFILNDVEAAYPNTVEAFKSLMSTYTPSNPSKEWYTKETFLFDIMKAAGYHTYWISNQSSTGIYDNVTARFAQLADSTIWVGTRGMGIGKSDLDELTLPIVRSVSSLPMKKFIVIHLMGSHEEFESRYPQGYAKFSPNDYSDKPKNQRRTLSAYDNSIFYNDFIVSELFQIFIGYNNLVIYFPDHALDIFDTDPEYAGHARTKDSISFRTGREIPFIYSGYETVMNHIPSPFCTTNLYEYLMDISITK